MLVLAQAVQAGEQKGDEMSTFLEDTKVPDRFVELGFAAAYLDGKRLAHRFYDTKSGFDVAVFFDERAANPRKGRKNKWRIIPVNDIFSLKFDGGCSNDLLYYLADREKADPDDAIALAQAIREEGNYIAREVWENLDDPGVVDLSLEATSHPVLAAIAVTTKPPTKVGQNAVDADLVFEIKTYQAYLNGQVYGYEIFFDGKPFGDTYGVWGFYNIEDLFSDIEANVPVLPMETARTEDVPAEYNGHKVLLVIRGLPGSGKSTAAKSWCRAEHNCCHFENDQFQCDADGRYLFDKEFALESKHICLGRVDHALSIGKNVAVSCVFVSKSSIEAYRRLAEKHKAKFVVWRCAGMFSGIHHVPQSVYRSMAAGMEDWPGEIAAWSFPKEA